MHLKFNCIVRFSSKRVESERFLNGICELFPCNVAKSLFMNLKTSQHHRDTLRCTAHGPELGSCIYFLKNAVYTVSAVCKQALPLGVSVREEMGTFG